MNIGIIGTGYVGLVTGACFAELGHHVICIDVNETKIAELKNGKIPIYEPGLEDMIVRNQQEGRLSFTTDLTEVIQSSLFLFITVGTPEAEDGSADMSYVYNVASEIGRNITSYKVIVNKSTVPIGTAIKVRSIIQEQLDKRGMQDMEFDVASNPEFLKEGAAIKDFMNPDRIVIGTNSSKSAELLKKLYLPLTNQGFNFIGMDIPSAELTKYATNAMLATRISFMNEMAAVCEKTGANIQLIEKGIGSDKRIGNRFLSAGVGYGGSCFPKDIRSLIKTASDHSVNLQILKAVDKVNQNQKKKLIEMVAQRFGDELSECNIAIWGLSFKPETDDIREAPAINSIKELRKYVATIHAHDPVALMNARKVLGEDKIQYFNNPYAALKNADALLIFTEWDDYRQPDLFKIKSLMRQPIIFDGRNLYDREELLDKGIIYTGIGR